MWKQLADEVAGEIASKYIKWSRYSLPLRAYVRLRSAVAAVGTIFMIIIRKAYCWT